jgi:transcriptional regulator with XRE-family HTH domain
MEAGRVLTYARRRAGLTQRGLAERAGVPQPTVARIERGTSVPRVDTLDRLLEACGEGLYARPRLGIGVDRSQIIEQLRWTPSVRSRVAEDSEMYHVDRPGGRPRRIEGWLPLLALRTLISHEVRFIVIGGYGGNLLGSPIVTRDTDICYQRDRENCDRLAAALRELDARPRQDLDLPFVLDGRTLYDGCNFTLVTVAGDFDCLCEPGRGFRYEDLLPNARTTHVEDVTVLVSNVEDLIRMKRAAGRPKDMWAIEILATLQEEIDRSPDPEP